MTLGEMMFPRKRLLVIFCVAVFVVSCGDNESDECKFPYDGPPPPHITTAIHVGGGDDFSGEADGICVWDGYEYQYHYTAINDFLAVNPKAVELVGTTEVSTCADAHKAIAVKNWLGGEGAGCS